MHTLGNHEVKMDILGNCQVNIVYQATKLD
jgi:hypothetical protein